MRTQTKDKTKYGLFRRSVLRTTALSALVVALAAFAPGCDDDDDTAGAPGPGTGPGTGPTSGNLVDVASNNPQLTTLTAALTRAGLTDTLSGSGPYTVFAPTNQAFIDSGITDLNAIPADQLRTILLYHVIGARVPAAEVKDGPVTSSADLTIFLGTADGVKVNGGNAVRGGANVTATDAMASNGVIHTVDRVLLPPDIPACVTYAGLTELSKAIGASAEVSAGTSLATTLQGPGPFTMFAPTNQAFTSIAPPASAAGLRDVLLYHAIGSRVASDAIPPKADSLFKNRWGNGVSLVFATAGGVKVNDASVVTPDVKCTNGVVHVIDRVLQPPDLASMVSIAGLTALRDAAVAAAPTSTGPIVDALRGQGPLTVFAPTNAAFDAIDVPSDVAALRDILLLHVVPADRPLASDQLPATAPTLLLGSSLTINSTDRTVSSRGTAGARIVTPDLNVTNGVIHVIDKVLLP